MPLSTLIAAWLAGALGAAHCLAMCGGFVAAMAGTTGTRPAAPLLPRGRLVWRRLSYNVGRITTYALFGAAAGGAGAAALSAVHWLPVQRALYVVANLFLLALAATIAWRRNGLAALQHAGLAVFARALPLVRSLAQRHSLAARYGMGMVWGLVPCALTYSVLPIALFAGGAWQGGAVMLAFGLGTLPNLLAAGWVLERAAGRLANPVVRWSAAALLAGFAVVGIWRALMGPASLGQHPFCL